MNLELISAPASDTLIVTSAEAVDQCRAWGRDDEVSFLDMLRSACQSEVEQILGRALSSQQWRATFERFPSGSNPILLPRPPLITIDSATYTDTNGDSQSLSGHVVNSNSSPIAIHPPSTGWPATDTDAHPAVTILYTCGHSAAQPVDPMLKHIVLLLIGRGYENREESVVGTIVSKFPFVYQYLQGHSYRDWTDYSVMP